MATNLCIIWIRPPQLQHMVSQPQHYWNSNLEKLCYGDCPVLHDVIRIWLHFWWLTTDNFQGPPFLLAVSSHTWTSLKDENARPNYNKNPNHFKTGSGTCPAFSKKFHCVSDKPFHTLCVCVCVPYACVLTSEPKFRHSIFNSIPILHPTGNNSILPSSSCLQALPDAPEGPNHHWLRITAPQHKWTSAR